MVQSYNPAGIRYTDKKNADNKYVWKRLHNKKYNKIEKKMYHRI